MAKVYVVIRKTIFFTEVYAVKDTMREAEKCIAESVYSRGEFTIVEKEK